MPRGNIKMLYYFCCGTPLNDLGLERRIDTLRLEGQGRLDGQRLTFSGPGGRANLEPDAGSQVWGCLFLVEERMLPVLDQEEVGAARREGRALFEGVQERCVYHTYPPQAGARAPKGVVETLRAAYSQAGLPQGQIDRALGLALK